jgi:hypothetical protein
VSIARKHILEVALGGSDETIRISKGEVAEESRNSPNFLIGGPGKVIVDLDSAALFEKPDGTPHVILPTSKQPKKTRPRIWRNRKKPDSPPQAPPSTGDDEEDGKATIEGFERFREAIDLRDHFLELRDVDPAKKARSVVSRSRDGIAIIATDVRFLFSAERGGKPSTLDTPYPVSEEAVQNIVYKYASTVISGADGPSQYTFIWINNMTSLIRAELAKFMNRHALTEYFASYGIPEVDSAHQREDTYRAETRRVLSPDEPQAERLKIPPVPTFVPRPDITTLFSKFAESFTRTARERGVQLEWIGVGTWISPVEKVFSRHIEAWKESRENAGLITADAMKKIGAETRLNRLIELIQEIPLASYEQSKAGMTNPIAVLRTVLGDYRKQLVQARDLWKNKGESAPLDVEDAIQIIEDLLWHQVGKGPASTGSAGVPDDDLGPDGGNEPSGAPGFAYADLIRLVGGDGATANRLIEHEREQFPNDTQEILVARAIDRLIQDRR